MPIPTKLKTISSDVAESISYSNKHYAFNPIGPLLAHHMEVNPPREGVQYNTAGLVTLDTHKRSLIMRWLQPIATDLATPLTA